MIRFSDLKMQSTQSGLTPNLEPYTYMWPRMPVGETPHWMQRSPESAFVRDMPEPSSDLANDSRWPAFFPSPICLVTTSDGRRVGLEKVVGASIVNRFPYVVALSFCRQPLSARHHARAAFTEILEEGGAVAVQFLAAGDDLDRALRAVSDVPDAKTDSRIAYSGLPTRPALTNGAPVLLSSYLVYEARLVRPGQDFEGQTTYETPWVDVGSHRMYFLEITAIQLRQDIAEGRTQIRWRSLPVWQPQNGTHAVGAALERLGQKGQYAKGYTPYYNFPSAGTAAFEADVTVHGMAVKYLPPLPAEQVEVDNDRARWPCFFPSSVGMITSWDAEGVPNLMPCGSTTVISRHPFMIAPCVSYAAINARYAPRQSLDAIRRTGRFGCGVPYINDEIVAAIRYAGNVSLAHDPAKLANAGLQVESQSWAPVLSALPVHYDCEVRGEVRLGTHIMFLGEVKRIRVRADVTPANPLVWCPWADVAPAGA